MILKKAMRETDVICFPHGFFISGIKRIEGGMSMIRRGRYRTALYCRVSREDGDRPESDSILTQRHLLEDYCARNAEFGVIDTYIDDGFTGTHFNRPDFQRMLSDIGAGKIDCVAVKDLSRFGRDYIEIGYYLERLFPSRGIRFIAVNDGVDSDKGPYDLMLPLKNIFNTMYARDVSEKVRKVFLSKQQRGEFVSGFPPFGYRKDPDNNNHFLPDPAAAETVRQIYEMRADGRSPREIAQTLNRDGVLSPIEYKRSNGDRLSVGQRYRGKCPWSDAAVRRVLSNEVYLGRMVSRRWLTEELRGKSRAVPRNDWIIVEGTHEPVVTELLWDKAHRTQSAPGRPENRAAPSRPSLFRGLLRCGDCGRALVRKSGSGTYLCGAYRQYGEIACSRHAVSERFLESVVCSDLNRALSGVCVDLSGRHTVKSGAKQQIAPQPKAMRQRQRLYEDYRAGRVTKEEYRTRRDALIAREAPPAAPPHTTRDCAGSAPDDREPWAVQLAELGKLQRLDRTTLEQAVREIRVFSDGHIEIEYLFASIPASEDAR